MKNQWPMVGAGLLGSVLGAVLTNALWWSARDAHAAGSQDEATRARRFEVVDSRGNVRGVWGIGEDDTDVYFALKSATSTYGGIGMSYSSARGSEFSMSNAGPGGDRDIPCVRQIHIGLDQDGKPKAYILGKGLKTLWEAK